MDPVSDFEEKLTDTAGSLQRDGQQAAEDLSGRAREAWSSAQEQAQRAMREGTEYIRDNRLPALIAAFVVGLVVGRSLAHRRPVSFANRYLAEPLDRSRDMLLALPLAAVGAMFTRYGRSAAATVRKAVHR